jgi:hypothetical protein
MMGPVGIRLEDQIGGDKYRTVGSMHASTTYGATACFTRSLQSDAGTSGTVRMRLVVDSSVL